MLHTIAQIKLWSSNDCMGPHARIKMGQPLVVHLPINFFSLSYGVGTIKK